MKRKIVLLLVAIILSTVGCNNAQSTSVDTTSTVAETLKLKERGQYYTPGFGEEYSVYSFDIPNENIVLYTWGNHTYLLGEISKNGETGISYSNVFLEGSQFIGLSNKYMLFLKEKERIAVPHEEKKNVAIGESLHQQIPFEELSDEDKNSFIYPIDVESVTQ